MWTEEQLKNYEGTLIINRDFQDRGFAFVEIIEVFVEETDEPVYEGIFYSHDVADEFLESIGF